MEKKAMNQAGDGQDREMRNQKFSSSPAPRTYCVDNHYYCALLQQTWVFIYIFLSIIMLLLLYMYKLKKNVCIFKILCPQNMLLKILLYYLL